MATSEAARSNSDWAFASGAFRKAMSDLVILGLPLATSMLVIRHD